MCVLAFCACSKATVCVHVGVYVCEGMCLRREKALTDIHYVIRGSRSKVYPPYGRGSAPHRAYR